MSLAAYMWACDLPMDACSYAAFKVLLAYADRSDELGMNAWASVSQLADKIGCSERTIQRARKELLDLDLMREGDQRLVDHITQRYRPTVYDVMTPAARLIHEGGSL